MDGKNITEAIKGLSDEWKSILFSSKNKDIFRAANSLILRQTIEITPEPCNVFNAFKLCDYNDLKVIIIGQDPYPTPGDAIGLAFSAGRDRPIPRSLKNIYECLIYHEFLSEMPEHGDLSAWAEQGVLLLNCALTTQKMSRGLHLSIWEPYTNSIISDISAAFTNRKLVFILWGAYAQSKEILIDKNHYVLKWGHPSPLSSLNRPDNTRRFQLCDNFTKCNELLELQKLDPIDWDPDCI